MPSGTWRGIVGVIKPTYSSGSLVEFIRLLPEGVGCIPMYAGIKEHSERGYLSAMETYHAKMSELAEIGVDLMHPEGGPPFMVRGHKAEQEIVGGWEAQYKVPIFTSGMSQAQALRALGIKKFVGCTYYRDQKMNDIFTRYFTDAGFEVLGMEGMDTSPDEADKISTETIYQHLKASFNKFRRRRASICSAPALGVSKISLRRKTIWAFPWFIRLPPGFGTCKSF
jgi:maleate isomerase